MIETAKQQERAILVGVELQETEHFDMSMEELASLAKTAGAEVVASYTQKRERYDSKSFVGSGKLEEIKAMVDAGYYFLTPEEAYKALTENALPAKKVVWLTFDDGNEDFYTIAYPILKKYKAKATNNIITGFVKKGNAGNLTVKQMKEMMAHGMSFQSHTVNHPDLSVNDKATQKAELTDSIDFLEDKLNTKVNTIAYPSGRYNQTTLDLAKKTYKLGLTTNEGLASAKDGLLSLNRVRILPTTTSKGLLSEIATDNK